MSTFLIPLSLELLNSSKLLSTSLINFLSLEPVLSKGGSSIIGKFSFEQMPMFSRCKLSLVLPFKKDENGAILFRV